MLEIPRSRLRNPSNRKRPVRWESSTPAMALENSRMRALAYGCSAEGGKAPALGVLITVQPRSSTTVNPLPWPLS